MSSVSLPVTRPTGRALLVGGPDCREKSLQRLREIGYACDEADDPYAAMVELSRRPQNYQSIVLSLKSLYREELHLIDTVKGRFPYIEIWVTDSDGFQAALADAISRGADGLLREDGLHRVAVARASDAAGRLNRPGRAKARNGKARPNRPARSDMKPPVPAQTAPQPEPSRQPVAEDSSRHAMDDMDGSGNEPVLSAEELRALLSDQPTASKRDASRGNR